MSAGYRNNTGGGRPWVPPSVVARLYAFGRASFPKAVHGPQLKSPQLYFYVTDWRADGTKLGRRRWRPGTDYAEDLGLSNTYEHVSNFHRDYYRMRGLLADSRLIVRGYCLGMATLADLAISWHSL